ncbi:hypothetical protein F5Y05DRAFT_411984 [Hypoxylon sp. FL0543]|nr:hypothetical protein F5Y05DRAFT_411984 [Hypoxylon sp. FL0543]
MAGKKHLSPEEERQRRAERKRVRTSYRTGATDEEKARALKIAIDRLPGKKYSWMNQEKLTPAKTMGKRVATECGVSSGPIAKELGIGEYSREATEVAEEHEKHEKQAAQALTTAAAERLLENTHVGPKTTAWAPASLQLPTPDPSPPAPVATEEFDDLEAFFMEPDDGAETTEQPKVPEEGTKENPISLSSRESSPVVISPREATPTAAPKKRKATEEAPKEPKKRPAKKARVAEPKKAEPKKAVPKKAVPKKAVPKKAEPKKEEPEEEYDEEEEMKDFEAFMEYAVDFLSEAS